MTKDKRVGWLYKEAEPDHIVVRLSGQDRKEFPDSNEGAVEARRYVTLAIGNDWSLEKMGFLGYRIILHEEVKA